MAKEIERKFLVKDHSYKELAFSRREISQGYLSTDADATVRVRICDGEAWLTVKSRNRGATRGEWEYPVPVEDARAMLAECCGTRVIEKTRWCVDAGDDLCWKWMSFTGAMQGLWLPSLNCPRRTPPLSRPRLRAMR